MHDGSLRFGWQDPPLIQSGCDCHTSLTRVAVACRLDEIDH